MQCVTKSRYDYRDIRKRFGIKQKNRRGHMYLIGKTGTGKSTRIQNMAAHDIEMGYGRLRVEVERAMSPWASYPARETDQRRLI